MRGARSSAQVAGAGLAALGDLRSLPGGMLKTALSVVVAEMADWWLPESPDRSHTGGVRELSDRHPLPGRRRGRGGVPRHTSLSATGHPK